MTIMVRTGWWTCTWARAQKIEDNAATPRLIVTVRGAGYRFEDEPV